MPTPASVPKDCSSAYVGGKGEKTRVAYNTSNVSSIITEPQVFKENVAMMYQFPEEEPASYMPELQTTELRVIDPYEDPNVWVIVDEGCNSCCHSEAWHRNAQEKWARQGFRSYLKSEEVTHFSGVGSSTTTGKYVLPFSLMLTPSRLRLPGLIESHQVRDGKHLMLPSQAAQAKLGFVKNVRRGTIMLEDYEGQEIEVCRQVNTGLYIIRIDHLLNRDDWASESKPWAC